MKTNVTVLLFFLLFHGLIQAQTEQPVGDWKPWFIKSGKTYRLPAPTSSKDEIAQVIAQQQTLDSAGWQQVLYWNAGAPNYRWQEMINKIWITDTASTGVLANLLLGTAIYDAMIVAWDTKYAYNRARPYTADNRVKAYVNKPQSPSYPCEHSVAAGVAATIIGHFYPHLADSVNKMAKEAIASRVAAGVAYPSDTRAGYELGKKIAEIEIAHTKDYIHKTAWDGKIPEGPTYWKGKNPMFPMAGRNKTVVLDSGNQYRPGPPPDFAKDMEELRKFKPTFRSISNAFYWANSPEDILSKKIFEYNIHLDPPQAARLYALSNVAIYDAFTACWDAKYAYWGLRPNQYDTTFKPTLIFTPPFPGYPSGHAVISGVNGELFSYFFPAERALFQKRAKDGAESRFQGGIHFRTDNEVGLELGRKVANAVIARAKKDGADDSVNWARH